MYFTTDNLAIFREDKPKPSGEAIDMDLEETKLLTLTEARARFDVEESVPKTKVSKAEIKPKSLPFVPLKPEAKPEEKAPVPKPVPEFIPKKVVPPVKKPSAPKPFPKPEKVAPEGIKSPSPRLIIIPFIAAIYKRIKFIKFQFIYFSHSIGLS